MATNLVNRNVRTERGRTSMRLEPELWDALHEICVREQMPVRDIICRARELVGPGGRTSAVRVYVVQYFRAAAAEKGNAEAGHVARTAGHGQDLTNEAGVTELAGAENSVLETDGARTVA
ncbi:MAG TPA: ribbon-helix-helix domain-containing protein [Steroidobacteraceae bacterium]|nr:ribbon-helix-helix domain-containing protein [Steroidobacteraceae bacterium]